MEQQTMSNFFSFVTGFVQDRNILRVIAQMDMFSDKGMPNSTLLKFVLSDNEKYGFDLDWFATRVLVSLKPSPHLIAVGPDGRVNVSSQEGDRQEEIDSSENGTKLNGDIRDLRVIGDYVYAAGMGRQVYRREGENKWVHRDAGVLQKPSTTEVTGFNSIDGISEDDITAAGFGGEIWNYHKGKWRQVVSPTNVILNKVKAVDEERTFVCGQRGVLLRGSGVDTWEVIKHGATTAQFWDMEWFNDTLYLATDNSLYRLTEDDYLEQVDMELGDKVTCGSLHANDGVLLSVGSKHICWTADGEKWNRLD